MEEHPLFEYCKKLDMSVGLFLSKDLELKIMVGDPQSDKLFISMEPANPYILGTERDEELIRYNRKTKEVTYVRTKTDVKSLVANSLVSLMEKEKNYKPPYHPWMLDILNGTLNLLKEAMRFKVINGEIVLV